MHLLWPARQATFMHGHVMDDADHHAIHMIIAGTIFSGAVDAPSAYFMKSPPNQMRDDDARRAVEDFSDVE